METFSVVHLFCVFMNAHANGPFNMNLFRYRNLRYKRPKFRNSKKKLIHFRIFFQMTKRVLANDIVVDVLTSTAPHIRHE